MWKYCHSHLIWLVFEATCTCFHWENVFVPLGLCTHWDTTCSGSFQDLNVNRLTYVHAWEECKVWSTYILITGYRSLHLHLPLLIPEPRAPSNPPKGMYNIFVLLQIPVQGDAVYAEWMVFPLSMLRASWLMLEINEFRCYGEKIFSPQNIQIHLISISTMNCARHIEDCGDYGCWPHNILIHLFPAWGKMFWAL